MQVMPKVNPKNEVGPPPQLLSPLPLLCQDNTMLYALIHLPGNDDNWDGEGSRCCIYLGPPQSAASLVRRIRAGLASPGPRLSLFVILIVVTSAMGTTMTRTMMTTIFVGAGKPCVQSMLAQVQGCALLPQGHVGCGCRSRSTVAPLVLSHYVGHVVVTVATPNHAFLFLYGCGMNRGGVGVGNKDPGGGCGQQQSGWMATKWVRKDQQKATTNLQWEHYNDAQ